MANRIIVSILAAVLCTAAFAQRLRYVDAAGLNVIGQPIPTDVPFARLDTSVYKFGDATIDRYADYSTGLAVLFRTDSRTIRARWETSGANSGSNMAAIGQKGLDLYIRKDGEWIFAGVGSPDMDKEPYDRHEGTIVADMAEGMKECLLYLPLFDCVKSLELGIDEDASIGPLENPFRHKIIVKGSSITHGAAASRPGMSYAARFGRDNGLYCCNLGFSGKSKLQKEYALTLADIPDVDAFIFDAFSNPKAEEIYERFDEFVDIVRKAHPGVPMIFLQTERRETRNFSTQKEAFEAAKQKAAKEKVLARMKEDRHIYFITSEDFLGDGHIATADGTHSTDLGFTYMLESISPKILKILKKYGIR